MKIYALYTSLEKGIKKNVKKLELIVDIGIKNDIKSKKGNKEILLLDKKSRDVVDSLTEGLCTDRFRENITIDEISMSELKVGQKIRIANTIIEITDFKKTCFIECNLRKKNKYCPLVQNVKGAKVIKSGYILLEDDIALI